MKKNNNIDAFLKAQMVGSLCAVSVMLVVVFSLAFCNRRDKESIRVQTELNQFKESLPNYQDSVLEYDAKNAEHIEQLTHVVDFLRKESFQNVNKDSLEKELHGLCARRNALVRAGVATNAHMARHLDSVRNANKYNLFVRNSAMQYSK